MSKYHNHRAVLPPITSTVAPDLRRFLDRVRETFDSEDGQVTKGDLKDLVPRL